MDKKAQCPAFSNTLLETSNENSRRMVLSEKSETDVSMKNCIGQDDGSQFKKAGKSEQRWMDCPSLLDAPAVLCRPLW
jgi:hypothetical protein